ncbi:MAG: pseudouridine-5'-phosphate glycosidase [Chloroflexi bacterium]|nr:pseudouridine-5'-phosphate glycosidase [Chloroflexota bacterium]
MANMTLHPTQLVLSAEVQNALTRGDRAVVALESTLITHGLPYPANVETALAMEQAIRDQGAVPATIAILAGKIVVGLSEAEIRDLAQRQDVRKCSRRDIAIAVARGEYGATTVAGTMIVAHMAGIRIFATGGIGGVHRGQPFDVSADLYELGRTPVAVVCSGAKSILDLPLTLEVLETQGVPILGLNTDHLPAFYTRQTDLPIDVCIGSPEEAAAIIDSSFGLELKQGLLVAVPVPAEDELAGSIAETAIAQATQEAHDRHLSGAKVTPYVLARVAELTEGESRRSNVSLLVNNARVAALIAEALRQRQQKGR